MRVLDASLFRSAAFVRFAGAALASASLEAEERQELLGALTHPDVFERAPELAASLERILQPHAGALSMLSRQAQRFRAAEREEILDLYTLGDATFVREMHRQLSDMRESTNEERLVLFIDPRNTTFIVGRMPDAPHRSILDFLGAAPENNYQGLINATLFLKSAGERDILRLMAFRAAFCMQRQQLGDDAWLRAAQIVHTSPALRPHMLGLTLHDATFEVALSKAPLPATRDTPFTDQRKKSAGF